MSASEFLDRLLIDGQRVDARIDGRLEDARTTRTMDGAASVALTFDDHDLELIESGLFSKPGKPTKKQQKIDDFDQADWVRFGGSRLVLDGWFTRLAGFNLDFAASDRTIGLTTEDEIAALMRKQEKAIKSTRTYPDGNAGSTRAQFIQRLFLMSRAAGAVGTAARGFFSPESSVVESIRALPKDEDREKGLAKHAAITVKGNPPTSHQKRVITIALGVADEEHAPELAVIAMLAGGIGESSLRDVMNGNQIPVDTYLRNPGAYGETSGYGGPWQGQVAEHGDNWFGRMSSDKRIEEEARSFLRGGRGYQGGGAISIARQHPDMDPGEIAIRVEGAISNFSSLSAAASFYGAWAAEARKILEAWGGVSTIITQPQRYEYKAGGKVNGEQRNYWIDAYDLAQEVRWRLFADLNILYYVSDEWLFQRRPVIRIDRGLLTGGLFEIHATADVGIPVAEIEVLANVADWKSPPGATVELGDTGPLNGRWLLRESEKDELRDQVKLTLRRPAPKLKEPAPKTRTKELTETLPDKGSTRDKIVAAVKKALELDKKYDLYQYAQVRPLPSTLFPANFRSPQGIMLKRVITDCSGFATLAYKAAGAPDPNGLGYNGSGWTGTLVANGHKTSDPQPGDLAFYGSGAPYGHVGVYIGGGEVIEFGGNPGPLKLATKYRSDFAGYWTYDLGDGD